MSNKETFLKKKINKKPVNKEPLWKGPVEDGITFSLLSRYLVCKDRFRVLVIDGLKVKEGFNHRLEYGNMWHICEEFYAGKRDWKKALFAYVAKLLIKYPLQKDDIVKWFSVCSIQFPLYIEFWDKHPEKGVQKKPIYQELSFQEKMILPSGRVFTLRGKWDSVDEVLRPEEDNWCLWGQENKTKGEVNALQLTRQLRYDLQTMIYLVALYNHEKVGIPTGIRYNVIRRPLSGGKGNIKQCKGETIEEYWERLKQYIVDEPETYFFRWDIRVTVPDIINFKRRTLLPILDNLYDDYEWWIACSQTGWDVFDSKKRHMAFPQHQNRHYRYPYGVYNPLLEGKPSDLDNYLDTGSKHGLERCETLFPELAV